MKTREYYVTIKGAQSNPFSDYYFVEAPNKRIAKWCALNLFQNEYVTNLTIKDIFVAEAGGKHEHC